MSASNIKQIVTTFTTFISIYENRDWAKNATAEDIKIAFKLAAFVEKTTENLSAKNCDSHLINTLKLCDYYDKDFFAKACDHLLLKFFKNRSVHESVVDIAVRMYTSLFPKTRFEAVLKDLILEAASFDAIVEFAAIHHKPDSLLKYELILNDWSKDLECGDRAKVEGLISESMNSFTVEISLPNLIGILVLNRENEVSKLILDSVLRKMLDRSILAKNFWLTLVRKIPKDHLSQMCVSYKDFCELFCNFLIYIAGMLEKEETDNGIKWISNSNTSLCPEITYNELESLFVHLCSCASTKNIVLMKLEKSRNFCDGCNVWEQINEKCLL